ncbi:DUF4255 domain-containing protein [Enterobacteriaceae bacterium LUAb1]
MTAIITSANAIVEVNKALQTVLLRYFGSDKMDIRFDLPDVTSSPSHPCISVFLYDVHEDLQLRQSEPARLNVSTRCLRPGWVNLNCNYLLTYWDTQSSDGNGPASKPNNQAVKVVTKILQALLNNRELSGIAGGYARIVPPQENLNSLGNFWQALGNRPRLSLMYSVTVPVLLESCPPQALVQTVSSEMVQQAAVSREALRRQLWQKLCEQLGAGAQQKLARVTLECQPQAEVKCDATAVVCNLRLSGIVAGSEQQALTDILHQWQKGPLSMLPYDDINIHIHKTDTRQLQYIENSVQE